MQLWGLSPWLRFCRWELAFLLYCRAHQKRSSLWLWILLCRSISQCLWLCFELSSYHWRCQWYRPCSHLTVIFWYYHDILIYQNIKLIVRFRDFAMFILSWYFDIIKCLLIYLLYAISRWYFDIIMIFWYIKIYIWKYQTNCEIPRFCNVYFIMIFWYYKMLVHVSFVCHLTVIFWYYHDSLMYQNIYMKISN